MAATMNATFMGKNFSTIQSVVKNHEDLTMKQMFDVFAQFVNDQEEIHCLDHDDETVLNLQSTKSPCFSDSVLCLGRIFQHLQGSKPRNATEIMMLSTESRQNSNGTFSQQFSQKEFYSCQCSMTSLVTEKATMVQMLESSKILREDLVWCWAMVMYWTKF